ncbi:hypothetical protein ACOI1H_26115, partial [Loktanella sp. DJP18]
MTDASTATPSETTTRAAGDKWIERFGKIKSIALKSGRKGQYAVIVLDCVKFEQTAFAFTTKTIDAIKSAGEGASVWLKGPMESVQRKNANGGTYSEDQLKVVYFKDKTVREGAAAAAEVAAPAAPVAEDLTVLTGVGAKVAEQLAEAGIVNFALLAAATDEALDAVKAGMAKRATTGDWRDQAAAHVAAAA